MEYTDLTDKIFQYEGRILKKNKTAYLGYTNSSIRFWTRGKQVRAFLLSNISEEINMAGLQVFMDDGKEPWNEIVVDREEGWYDICMLPDDRVHLVTIVKITEAAMSHVGIRAIAVEDGEIPEKDFPERPELKLEFIGDSITCGYGVLGEPESEYTIREENGLYSYAQKAAEILGARARFLSASGYGAYIEYTGNRDGNVLKLYPYTNWFLDKTERYDFTEYIPDVVVINLGTNDSGHMEQEDVQRGFIDAYTGLIRSIKKEYPKTNILCICGTLCDFMFEWIERAVAICREEGIDRIYTLELPYHDVARDGMASMHPSRITHEKDGYRVAQRIKEILNTERK